MEMVCPMFKRERERENIYHIIMKWRNSVQNFHFLLLLISGIHFGEREKKKRNKRWWVGMVVVVVDFETKRKFFFFFIIGWMEIPMKIFTKKFFFFVFFLWLDFSFLCFQDVFFSISFSFHLSFHSCPWRSYDIRIFSPIFKCLGIFFFWLFRRIKETKNTNPILEFFLLFAPNLLDIFLFHFGFLAFFFILFPRFISFRFYRSP